MNIFQLVYLFLIVFAGYKFAGYLEPHFGQAGWIVGFITGCVVVIVIFKAIRILLDISDKWCPPRPICKNKKCRSEDYEMLESSPSRVIFCCKCGIKYLFTKNRFMEILEDGTSCPYMKRKTSFSSWQVDEKDVSAKDTTSKNAQSDESRQFRLEETKDSGSAEKVP